LPTHVGKRHPPCATAARIAAAASRPGTGAWTHGVAHKAIVIQRALNLIRPIWHNARCNAPSGRFEIAHGRALSVRRTKRFRFWWMVSSARLPPNGSRCAFQPGCGQLADIMRIPPSNRGHTVRARALSARAVTTRHAVGAGSGAGRWQCRCKAGCALHNGCDVCGSAVSGRFDFLECVGPGLMELLPPLSHTKNGG